MLMSTQSASNLLVSFIYCRLILLGAFYLSIEVTQQLLLHWHFKNC